MPGLLTQQQAVQPAATAQAAPRAAGLADPQAGLLARPQAGLQGDPQPNVSPEEQQAYEQFVDNALTVIFDDKTLPGIVENLKGDGNPVEGLANTVVAVIGRVATGSESAGQPVPPDILMHGGAEILGVLADLAKQAGIHEFTEQEMETAMFKALDLYQDQKGGQQEPNEAATEDANQLLALEQSGELDGVAQAMSERAGG